MANTVQFGHYYGFTLAELHQELERYKEEVKRQTSDKITAFSVNGRSYTYGPNRDLTLQEWQVEILAAIAALDPENNPMPSQWGKTTF